MATFNKKMVFLKGFFYAKPTWDDRTIQFHFLLGARVLLSIPFVPGFNSDIQMRWFLLSIHSLQQQELSHRWGLIKKRGLPKIPLFQHVSILSHLGHLRNSVAGSDTWPREKDPGWPRHHCDLTVTSLWPHWNREISWNILISGPWTTIYKNLPRHIPLVI